MSAHRTKSMRGKSRTCAEQIRRIAPFTCFKVNFKALVGAIGVIEQEFGYACVTVALRAAGARGAFVGDSRCAFNDLECA